MVSFSCPVCGDVVKKPKALSHAQMCGASHMSCIDCMETFDHDTLRHHTSCVTEVQKYQGKWLAKNQGGGGSNNKNNKRTHSDDDDEVDEKKVSRLVRPKTFSFDALGSSSSDDDDWVKSSSKAAKKKKGTGSATASPAASAARPKAGTKRVRQESDSDSDDDKEEGKASRHPSSKRAKNGDGDKTPASHRTASPKHDTSGKQRAEEKDTGRQSKTSRKAVGNSPLMLPQSTEEYVLSGTREQQRDADISVPGISLGTPEVVRDVIEGILSEHKGGGGLTPKQLAPLLAGAYEKRVNKHFRQCVEAMMSDQRVIRPDKNGNVKLC